MINQEIGRRDLIRTLAAFASMSYAENLLGTVRMRPREIAGVERLIIVYHPDGVFLEQWQPRASQGSISELPESLLPLAPFVEDLIILRNLYLGDGNGDGHEEASRMLLTGSKDPSQGSLDIHLAESLQQALLHVGILSSKAQGHSISFLPGGAEKIADDSPLAVYERLFEKEAAGGFQTDPVILQSLARELELYTQALDNDAEKLKLTEHAKQIRWLQGRGESCGGYDISRFPYTEEQKWVDKSAPLIMRMQMQSILEAMSCGLSRVATLQFSRHTSPLKMDYDWLERWDNQYPMESHQASHNSGAIHAQQKKWLHQQLAFLFAALKQRPEPNPQRSGSMLDHTLVLVVTEIAQGASHSRKDMPYYLLGGGGYRPLSGGRIVDCRGASHAQLLASVSSLMGVPARGAYAGAGSLAGLLMG